MQSALGAAAPAAANVRSQAPKAPVQVRSKPIVLVFVTCRPTSRSGEAFALPATGAQIAGSMIFTGSCASLKLESGK